MNIESVLIYPFQRQYFVVVIAIFFASLSITIADNSPRIAVVESSTATQALLAKPGTYLGEKFTFEEKHTGEVLVRIGVWESGVAKRFIKNFPFTEYVLMISGKVNVIENDGTSRTFVAGDTFVIPKGWSGIWDVEERMKKQIVRIGNENQ